MPVVVITSVTRRNDDVIVKGTVDGVPTQAHVWFSHISTLGTLAAKKTYAAQQLAATVQPADVDLGITGTITV